MPIQRELYFGYVKAMFNGLGFICIALGTFFIFGSAPLLKFIPFLIMAFAMMVYPTTSASNEEEIGLAMMRMVMGFLLVIMFSFVALGDVLRFNILLWLSLSAIAAGFFISFPVIEVGELKGTGADVMRGIRKTFEDVGKNINIGMLKARGGGALGGLIKWFLIIIVIVIFYLFFSEMLFSIFVPEYSLGSGSMIIAPIIGILLCIFSFVGGCRLRDKMGSVNPMILGICGGVGLFCGSIALMSNVISFIVFSLVVGFGVLAAMPVDKVRPVLGIPILMIALATTTIAYPDVMGEAVFGIWWPTIDYSIDSTIGPLLDNMRSPFETLGSGYSCLVNPQKCYMDYQPKTSTEEGIRSVEVTRIDFVGIGKIDESTVNPIMVIATVENRGNEDAENINVIPKIPVYSQGVEGELGTNAGYVEIICQNGAKSTSGCIIDKLVSGEIREFVLNYNINMPPKPGNYIAMGADVLYETRVTGQVDVMVMDEPYYLKLSKNNQLQRSEQVTEDTGGPVRLGLALMRNEMPVRDNQQGVPVMLYLRNEGPGVLQSVVSVEVDINDLEAGRRCYKDAEGNYNLRGLDRLMEPPPVEDRYKIISGGDIGATCISIVPDIDVEQKTFAITGEVVYIYNSSSERSMAVEFLEETTTTLDYGETTTTLGYEETTTTLDYGETTTTLGGGGGSGTCTDNDGGLNYFTFSCISGMCDSCNSGVLTEYWCNGNQVATELYNCPLGCNLADPRQCEEGEYVTESSEGKCTDYEGGKDYFSDETLCLQSPCSSGYCPYPNCDASPDGCAEAEGGTEVATGDYVIENYCGNGVILKEWYRCPYGCDNGVCKLT